MSTGLGFGATLYLDHGREGTATLYRQGEYPFGAIAEVTFMWCPLATSCDTTTKDTDIMPLESRTSSTSSIEAASSTDKGVVHRQLWLWVHPAGYTDTLRAIAGVFGFDSHGDSSDSSSNEEEVMDTTEGSSSQEQHKIKGLDNLSKGDGVKVSVASSIVNPFFTSVSSTVTVRSLKDELARFRLTGPLSHGILQETLLPSSLPPSPDTAGDREPSVHATWWRDHASHPSHAHRHQAQADIWLAWKPVVSPLELEPRCILGLTVRDPRPQLPQKRTPLKAETDMDGEYTVKHEIFVS